MIILRQLSLSNYLLYKSFNWKIPNNGISIIRGINHDSKNASRNAVGKSLIPYSIATILEGEPPFSQGRNAAKTILSINSTATLALTKNNVSWRLTQFGGQKVTYSISKNSQELEIKKIADQEKYIKDIFPLSPEVFYSTFYISSYRPSVLLYGSPAQRHDYFEEIFDLGVYDLIHKQLSKHKFEIESSAARLSQLKMKANDLQTKVGNSPESLEDRLTELRKRSTKIMTTMDKWTKMQAKLQTMIAINEQLHFKLPHDELLGKLHKAESKLLEYEQKQKHLQKNAVVWAAMQERQGRIKEIKSRLTQIKLQKVKQPQDVNPYISKLNECKAYENQIKVCNGYIAKYGRPDVNLVDHKNAIAELAQAELQLKQFHKLKGKSKCPCCGQPIENMDTNVKTLTKSIDDLRERSKRIETAWLVKKAIDKIGHLLSVDVAALKHQVDRINNQKLMYDEYTKKLAQKNELQAELNSIKVESAKPVDDAELKQTDAVVKQLHGLIPRLRADISLIEKLDSLDCNLSVESAKELLTKISKDIHDNSNRASKISDALSKTAMQVSEQRIISRELDELDTEITDLEKQIEDRDVINILTAAYSSKGIRILQLQSLGTAFASILNQTSSLLFSVPCNFQSEVDINKFMIVAERNGKASDVRYFSGAESRKFLALAAMAIYQMSPDNIRCNTMILDELESGQSIADRNLFAKDFLPYLQRIVPHVVVITPLDKEELYIQGAREYLVEKRNNTSTFRQIS